MHHQIYTPSHLWGRRQFVKTMATSSLLAGGGLLMSAPGQASVSSDQVSELSGPEFDLDLREVEVNFTGKPRRGTAINGTIPGPILRMREGDDITIRVTNHLPVTSSIHWHGLILPTNMDGVPGLSFAGIAPGATYVYRFKAVQSGTYWYHSHSGFQEQTGLYGSIVIEPRSSDPVTYDRDYVVLLSDWSDQKPEAIYATLKKLSHYYNTRERTVGDFVEEVQKKGFSQTMQDRHMWNAMRMSDRDLSDVTGWTYTFLTNGLTPDTGWEGLFTPGEKVRLRFINASAMTFFDVRIDGLPMQVVATDGQNIRPVEGIEEFRIGVAETYDVVVQPKSSGAHTIFAQAIDRSGYARGTLTSQRGLQAAVPVMDPMPSLSHADMGMDHGLMGHHSVNEGAGAHNSHAAPAREPRVPVVEGSHVDMMATHPQVRLNDPGVGLRNNNRRVLTYADIVGLTSTIDKRDPSREIELHLTGNMSRYMWSINGVAFNDAKPIVLRYGERVRVTLINNTMMNHPMHLHGMWSELETGNADYLPRKHTIVVQPGSQISYLVTADAKGHWAYHCHLLYHMKGMFRRVVVA